MLFSTKKQFLNVDTNFSRQSIAYFPFLEELEIHYYFELSFPINLSSLLQTEWFSQLRGWLPIASTDVVFCQVLFGRNLLMYAYDSNDT